MGARKLYAIIVLLLVQFALTETGLASGNVELDRAIEKFDKINYLPNLMPIIIGNKDFIGLTQEQVDELDDWRKSNKAPMAAAMQQIVRKRVEIKQAALSLTISSSRIIQMQNEIFRLQREVLEYKLSFRERVVQTFTDENWISFFLVLAEEDVGFTAPPYYVEK